MAAHTKSEAESVECGFQMSRRFDQECDVGELLFPGELTKKQHSETLCASETVVHEGIGLFRVDRSVQSVALAVDANHGFVNRNLIRTHITVRL